MANQLVVDEYRNLDFTKMRAEACDERTELVTITGNVARLGHVGIAVVDLERSVDFYTKILGMRLSEMFHYGPNEVGHGVAVLAGAFVRGDKDTVHHRLSIFTLRNPIEKVPGAQTLGLHHIAFEFDTREDLLVLYKRFKDQEIPIVNARVGGPGNHTRFYGLDPDGNILEFYWNIDQIGWDDKSHVYPPIQEVELDDFNFEEYDRLRRSLDDKDWSSLDATKLRLSTN